MYNFYSDDVTALLELTLKLRDQKLIPEQFEIINLSCVQAVENFAAVPLQTLCIFGEKRTF